MARGRKTEGKDRKRAKRHRYQAELEDGEASNGLVRKKKNSTCKIEIHLHFKTNARKIQ